MGCPHTGFTKGQKIHIILKSGSSFVDQYKESKSGVIITEDAGRIQLSDIRSTSVYRSKSHS